MTLVLGANGLGKTTLVSMLYRLLTGPHDIPALLQTADLGNANLDVKRLNPKLLKSFANRVADNAQEASAKLEFYVGDELVLVERNLSDLTLRSFRVGSSTLSPKEELYQSEMERLANISSFGDWILLLRYIVFYFEDRRSLIWDSSAQRHVLRILFMKPDLAKTWLHNERKILEADSEFRNMRSIVNRQENRLAYDESIDANVNEIRQELQELGRHLESEEAEVEDADLRLPEIVEHYETARLKYMTLEQERDSGFRELERYQLLAINSQLPTLSDSVRYILAQLMTESECLVCGNNVPKVVASMRNRIRNNKCVICGTDLIALTDYDHDSIDQETLKDHYEMLRKLDNELEAAGKTLRDAESDRTTTVSRIQSLRSLIANRRGRIEALLNGLPPDEGRLYEQRTELASLRSTLENLRLDLESMRQSFSHSIVQTNETIETKATIVQDSFQEIAKEFLFEDCSLVWSPKPTRLGQTGNTFDFPAFELNLGGSDFSSALRRTGPDEVSESQREFIDISFRMALAKIATNSRVTSLIVDAPEASLDTVFANRAARVLGTFGKPDAGNRLVVTSNLVEGRLIAALIKRSTSAGHQAPQIVDLFGIAAPTAAVNSFSAEYDRAKKHLLHSVDESK